MSQVFDNPDHAKARTLFRRILTFRSIRADDVSLVAILHLVDSAIPFLPVLDEKYEVLGYLAKPSSIQRDVDVYISAALPGKQHVLDKEHIRSNPAAILRGLLPRIDVDGGKSRRRLVLLDIGGYFAAGEPGQEGSFGRALESVANCAEEMGYSLEGIVEDTQNGDARYVTALQEMKSEPSFRVFSVADSPLKSPENHLVGVAITFSIEGLLRKSNIVLQSRRAGVIGFGPIGRSVAHSLRSRGINVSVCEEDPIRLAQAAAQGFPSYRYKYGFEEFARNLNLVVSATGAGAKGKPRPLGVETFRYLRRGTFVASVTSQDDEIDLESMLSDYHAEPLRYNPRVTRWVHNDELVPDTSGGMARSSNNPSFYLMSSGNAVNFEDGGVVGPAIQLLQGEIIAAVEEVVDPSRRYVEGRIVHSVPAEVRVRVANAWLDQYLVDSAVSETD